MTENPDKSDFITLVVDVGGTNSRFAVAQAGVVRRETLMRLRNDQFETFEAACAEFIGALAGDMRIDQVVVALAGPVDGDIARLTNRDWTISTERLAAITGADRQRVWLLNDLQAQGHALFYLDPSLLRPLRPGMERPGPHLVVGLGTGFNLSLVLSAGDRFIATAAEAGHLELPRHLPFVDRRPELGAAIHGFSVEEVLSGRGLETLTRLICPGRAALAGPDISAALASAEPGELHDVGVVFAEVLGRVLAQLVLVTLPVSGVTFCGSVARALVPALPRYGFEAAYLGDGRMQNLLGPIPMRVLWDDFAALTGCAVFNPA